MQRIAIHTISFVARCESGLHIGGSQDELTIGGSDNPVIKNPETHKPYIPGSSLKGKMRAELEKKLGRFGGKRDDEPCGCGNMDCPVCRVFGAHKNPRSNLGPSRIIVRDGRLIQGGRIENKTENVISRKSGGANPRSNERVVEGSEFQMRIVLQVFDLDARFQYKDRKDHIHQGDEAFQAVVADGLYLIQLTGLGGGTSRGSGTVSFDKFKLDDKTWTRWSA